MPAVKIERDAAAVSLASARLVGSKPLAGMPAPLPANGRQRDSRSGGAFLGSGKEPVVMCARPGHLLAGLFGA